MPHSTTMILTCEHCGHVIVTGARHPRVYWHRLTPGLVAALRKFRRAVGRKGTNEIHLLRDVRGDIELTRHEWANFTKLRFFALVAKARNPDGSHKTGYWVLTRRGSRFMKGVEAVSARVQTTNNTVIGHSEQKLMVSDFPGDLPWWDRDPDFEIVDGNILMPAPTQAHLAFQAHLALTQQT